MAKMGRIPDAVKHRFKEMLESPSGYAKFKRIMAATEKEDIYLKYFQEALDRSEGKAPISLDMDVNDVTARPTAEEVNAAIASIGNIEEGSGMETKQ